MAKGSFLVSRTTARVLIDQKLGGDIVYISSKNFGLRRTGSSWNTHRVAVAGEA